MIVKVLVARIVLFGLAGALAVLVPLGFRHGLFQGFWRNHRNSQ